MKRNQDYELVKMADTYVLVPASNLPNELNGMHLLNETGVLLWNALEADVTTEELLHVIMEDYEIDVATARKDINEFVNGLRSIGVLDE